MNLIKIPDRTERLKQTRERMKMLFDKTAQREDEARGLDVNLSDKQNKEFEELIDQLVQTFDETGHFVAYVGD